MLFANYQSVGAGSNSMGLAIPSPRRSGGPTFRMSLDNFRRVNLAVVIVRLLFGFARHTLARNAPRSRISIRAASSSEDHSASHEVKSPSEATSKSIGSSSASMVAKGAWQVRSDIRAANARSNEHKAQEHHMTKRGIHCFFFVQTRSPARVVRKGFEKACGSRRTEIQFVRVKQQ